MLPLNPPVTKKKAVDVKLINLPIFDQNAKLLSENVWPLYHGIFNGLYVIVKDSNEKSQLNNLVSGNLKIKML